MILDLHVHSVFSGDSPVTPAQYAARLTELRAEYDLAGFALMEHNRFVSAAECDLAGLSRQYGIIIVAGVEIDTYWGHLLVYGMTEALWNKIRDTGQRRQEPLALARLIADEGAVGVPAHPYRFYIGMGDRCRELAGLAAVEGLNGSNSEQENRSALNFAARHGLATVGGSDAHFLAELGKTLTRFVNPVRDGADLVRELKAGRCEAITLEQARKG